MTVLLSSACGDRSTPSLTGNRDPSNNGATEAAINSGTIQSRKTQPGEAAATASMAGSRLQSVVPQTNRSDLARSGAAHFSGAEQLISAEGIGPAKFGMSPKELKQQLGPRFEFHQELNLLPHWDAIAVRQSGQVLYYLLHPANPSWSETDPIQHLLTENPRFHTHEGVSPGMTIGQIQPLYGNPLHNHHQAPTADPPASPNPPPISFNFLDSPPP